MSEVLLQYTPVKSKRLLGNASLGKSRVNGLISKFTLPTNIKAR